MLKVKKTANIGYWLTNSAVGFGYLQEAVQTLENVLFSLILIA